MLLFVAHALAASPADVVLLQWPGAPLEATDSKLQRKLERVFDAFYVKLPDGFDEAMKSSLRDQLLAALGREEPDGPRTPARKLKRASAADSF